MLKVLKSLFSRESGSKIQAKNRLQFVLVQDRAGLNNDELAGFRKELLSVIEKYFIVKEGDFGIDYKRDGNTTKLTINSPVVAKRDIVKKSDSSLDSKDLSDDSSYSDEKLEIRSKNDSKDSSKNFKKKKASNN